MYRLVPVDASNTLQLMLILPDMTKNIVICCRRCNLVHRIPEDGCHEQALQGTVHVTCVAQVVQATWESAVLHQARRS